MQKQITEIAQRFETLGRLVRVEPFGTGHIHDTFLAVFEQKGMFTRYLLQGINQKVFPNPRVLMENIQRITAYIQKKIAQWNAGNRRTRALTLVPSWEGLPYFTDEQGRFWRMFEFIEGRTYKRLSEPNQAFEAARAFGFFEAVLEDFPKPPPVEIIPDFHNTKKRFMNFQKIVDSDSFNRCHIAKKEIDFALKHALLAPFLVELKSKAKIPERITHNDTKIDNVIFDTHQPEAICVIDLDTVMPGVLAYDFGDMVRSMTCPKDEDEEHLESIYIRMPLFRELAAGYLEGTRGFITNEERKTLVAGAKVICFEQGIRFLGDYLQGDVYYKTSYKQQNLRRARTQFKLLSSIIENEKEMMRIIREIS